MIRIFLRKIRINQKAEKSRLSRKNSAGFTLIEVLVVIAIIVLMMAIAMPSVSSYFQLSLNQASRDLAKVIKESYNSSVLTGNVYRIVFDLEKQQYWVEVGAPTELLDTGETKKKEERRKRFFSSGEETEKQSSFALARDVTRSKKSLPTGVSYEDIVTEQSSEPISKGLAYSHFFPHGMTEQTLIHLKDTSEHFTSLVIRFLGNTDTYDEHIDEKVAFEE